jgi:transcriptional regulator with XRE-family HTH domain
MPKHNLDGEMTGSELRALRTARGMTLAEFGAALGVAAASLDLMETGQAAITPRTAMAARYLEAQPLLKRAAQSLKLIRRDQSYRGRHASISTYDDIVRHLREAGATEAAKPAAGSARRS